MDISNREQFITIEKQKYFIKSQIHGRYYCSELLDDTNLPKNVKETLSKIHSILLKDNLSESNIGQIYDLINDLSISDISYEMRILLKQLSDSLILPDDNDFLYDNEVESILDPYLEVKLKIYDYFKKTKYSEALNLVNQILENDKLSNYDNFIILGIKAKILAEMQDFEYADQIVNLTLGQYELLSQKEKNELFIQNEELDAYYLKNLFNIELEEFLTVKLSTLYIIKGFYKEIIGLYSEVIEQIDKILPLYSKSKCELSYADLLNQKANMQFRINNYDSSLRNYKIVFEIYLQINDLHRHKIIFNNISRIFINLREYEKALDFVERGIQISEFDVFNEILNISKAVLLYKINNYNGAFELLHNFLDDTKNYNSDNLDILFNLNVALLLFLCLNIDKDNFKVGKIFYNKIRILSKNKKYFRSDYKRINDLILNFIDNNSFQNNSKLISQEIKKVLLIQDLPLLIKELL